MYLKIASNVDQKTFKDDFPVFHNVFDLYDKL